MHRRLQRGSQAAGIFKRRRESKSSHAKMKPPGKSSARNKGCDDQGIKKSKDCHDQGIAKAFATKSTT
jgi:hypothetical protein